MPRTVNDEINPSFTNIRRMVPNGVPEVYKTFSRQEGWLRESLPGTTLLNGIATPGQTPCSRDRACKIPNGTQYSQRVISDRHRMSARTRRDKHTYRDFETVKRTAGALQPAAPSSDPLQCNPCLLVSTWVRHLRLTFSTYL